MLVPVRAPGFHKYEPNASTPDTVIVNGVPAHTVDEDGLTTRVGVGLTNKDTVATAVHPETLVPVTVYPVVVIGETDIVAVVAPVFHKYVEAPLAVKTALAPGHIAVGLATAVIVGLGFTKTDTVVEPLHPAVEPVTV